MTKTKTKTKWLCFYEPPKKKDDYGWEYDGQRLFVNSEDPTRIYIADNSGDNPDETDDHRVELDLSIPGQFQWFGDGKECDRLPKWTGFSTTDGHSVGCITIEAALILVKRHGAKLEINLSDTQKQLAISLATLVCSDSEED